MRTRDRLDERLGEQRPDATQAFHEVYIGAANDWYNHALAVQEAGKGG